MGSSVVIVFLVLSSALGKTNAEIDLSPWYSTLPTESTSSQYSTTPALATLGPSTTPTVSSFQGTETWIYVVIGVAVVLVVVCCQSLFFYLYIRKLKKSEPPRNINTTSFIQNENSEVRYQRAPSRSITNQSNNKAPEQCHSSSLYGYECAKEKKPTPPPTSTLPKRNRPRLPLPSDFQGDPKSYTITPDLTPQLLEQRGRQVSTMPSRPPQCFNAQAPILAQSPQTRRLPTPVRTPVLKPRGTPKSERSSKLYESLPDLREKLPPKPVTIQPPVGLTQPKPPRRFPGTDTASPLMPPKVRMPLPQENNRNGPGSVSNELMEKLQKRQALISQKTSTGSAQVAKPPIFPPSKVTPEPIVNESSSDEEWTLEAINPINMYNI